MLDRNDSIYRITVPGAFDKFEGPQEFCDYLSRLKKGYTIRSLLALYAYAQQAGSLDFRKVRLSKLMKKTMFQHKARDPAQEEKQRFSEDLDYFNSVSFILSGINMQRPTNPFQIHDSTIYSKNNEDKSVIRILNGRLLIPPPTEHRRPRYFSESLLTLDARRESTIRLGFAIQNRIGQMSYKKNLEWDRALLIRYAGYEDTDAGNPSKASFQLKETVEELLDHGIIGKISSMEITTDNKQQFTISPAFDFSDIWEWENRH